MIQFRRVQVITEVIFILKQFSHHFDNLYDIIPGASDNGLNCVVMLEVLRKLSNLKTPLLNNVIFLFNGAEENPLQVQKSKQIIKISELNVFFIFQAAHGFITQHKWSKEVRVVVNLDSAGAGGKDILFQTSSTFPWLIEVINSNVIKC